MPVYTDDFSWYVAKDLKDLRKLLVTEDQLFNDQEFDIITWEVCPPDEFMTLILEDDEPVIKETKTFAEWEEQFGRGFLCSTEW